VAGVVTPRKPERTVVEPGGPRISLFVWAILVVILLGAAAAVGFFVGGRVEVVVPRKDIAAYHRITGADLEERTIWKEGSNGTDVRRKSELVGHVALTDLPSGHPVESADAISPPASAPAHPVILEVTPGNASALDLEVGEPIVLNLSPKRRGVEPDSLPGWLVAIPDDGADAKQAYAVALAPAEARRLLELLGRSRLLISSGN
jgi:hypothetical protein